MDNDTAAGIALIVLSVIALAFWAGAELQLRRPRNQERLDENRDAIANAIGLIDKRRGATYAGDFADQVEQRLTVIDGGAR